jgi:RNA polymerase sigma-70 factor (ECF subfamily)
MGRAADLAKSTAPQARAGESDAQLLAAVAAGSEGALAELSRRYHAAVERVCRSVVGRDSADCTQEVFVRVWRKADLYDERQGSATGWLMKLTRNVAYNLTRKTRFSVVELDTEPAVEDGSPVERFWLEQALAALPERQRTVIELAYFHDRSQVQIAAELGVPLGTVKSWTRRGMNRLAQLMEQDR